MAEGSWTLAGDLDTMASKTAFQDAHHGLIEGKARFTWGLNASRAAFVHLMRAIGKKSIEEWSMRAGTDPKIGRRAPDMHRQ